MTETHMVGTVHELWPDPAQAARLTRFNTRRVMEESSSYRDGPSHVITGGRAEGKTTAAMRWLLDATRDTPRVLVVSSVDMASGLKHAHGIKGGDPRIISYRQLINAGPRPDVQYGIDESVDILGALLGLTSAPHLVTVTTAAEWQG